MDCVHEGAPCPSISSVTEYAKGTEIRPFLAVLQEVHDGIPLWYGKQGYINTTHVAIAISRLFGVYGESCAATTLVTPTRGAPFQESCGIWPVYNQLKSFLNHTMWGRILTMQHEEKSVCGCCGQRMVVPTYSKSGMTTFGYCLLCSTVYGCSARQTCGRKEFWENAGWTAAEVGSVVNRSPTCEKKTKFIESLSDSLQRCYRSCTVALTEWVFLINAGLWSVCHKQMNDAFAIVARAARLVASSDYKSGFGPRRHVDWLTPECTRRHGVQRLAIEADDVSSCCWEAWVRRVVKYKLSESPETILKKLGPYGQEAANMWDPVWATGNMDVLSRYVSGAFDWTSSAEIKDLQVEVVKRMLLHGSQPTEDDEMLLHGGVTHALLTASVAFRDHLDAAYSGSCTMAKLKTGGLQHVLAYTADILFATLVWIKNEDRPRPKSGGAPGHGWAPNLEYAYIMDVLANKELFGAPCAYCAKMDKAHGSMCTLAMCSSRRGGPDTVNCYAVMRSDLAERRKWGGDDGDYGECVFGLFFLTHGMRLRGMDMKTKGARRLARQMFLVASLSPVVSGADIGDRSMMYNVNRDASHKYSISDTLKGSSEEVERSARASKRGSGARAEEDVEAEEASHRANMFGSALGAVAETLEVVDETVETAEVASTDVESAEDVGASVASANAGDGDPSAVDFVLASVLGVLAEREEENVVAARHAPKPVGPEHDAEYVEDSGECGPSVASLPAPRFGDDDETIRLSSVPDVIGSKGGKEPRKEWVDLAQEKRNWSDLSEPEGEWLESAATRRKAKSTQATAKTTGPPTVAASGPAIASRTRSRGSPSPGQDGALAPSVVEPLTPRSTKAKKAKSSPPSAVTTPARKGRGGTYPTDDSVPKGKGVPSIAMNSPCPRDVGDSKGKGPPSSVMSSPSPRKGEDSKGKGAPSSVMSPPTSKVDDSKGKGAPSSVMSSPTSKVADDAPTKGTPSIVMSPPAKSTRHLPTPRKRVCPEVPESGTEWAGRAFRAVAAAEDREMMVRDDDDAMAAGFPQGTVQKRRQVVEDAIGNATGNYRESQEGFKGMGFTRKDRMILEADRKAKEAESRAAGSAMVGQGVQIMQALSGKGSAEEGRRISRQASGRPWNPPIPENAACHLDVEGREVSSAGAASSTVVPAVLPAVVAAVPLSPAGTVEGEQTAEEKKIASELLELEQLLIGVDIDQDEEDTALGRFDSEGGTVASLSAAQRAEEEALCARQAAVEAARVETERVAAAHAEAEAEAARIAVVAAEVKAKAEAAHLAAVKEAARLAAIAELAKAEVIRVEAMAQAERDRVEAARVAVEVEAARVAAAAEAARVEAAAVELARVEAAAESVRVATLAEAERVARVAAELPFEAVPDSPSPEPIVPALVIAAVRPAPVVVVASVDDVSLEPEDEDMFVSVDGSVLDPSLQAGRKKRESEVRQQLIEKARAEAREAKKLAGATNDEKFRDVVSRSATALERVVAYSQRSGEVFAGSVREDVFQMCKSLMQRIRDVDPAGSPNASSSSALPSQGGPPPKEASEDVTGSEECYCLPVVSRKRKAPTKAETAAKVSKPGGKGKGGTPGPVRPEGGLRPSRNALEVDVQARAIVQEEDRLRKAEEREHVGGAIQSLTLCSSRASHEVREVPTARIALCPVQAVCGICEDAVCRRVNAHSDKCGDWYVSRDQVTFMATESVFQGRNVMHPQATGMFAQVMMDHRNSTLGIQRVLNAMGEQARMDLYQGWVRRMKLLLELDDGGEFAKSPAVREAEAAASKDDVANARARREEKTVVRNALMDKTLKAVTVKVVAPVPPPFPEEEEDFQ